MIDVWIRFPAAENLSFSSPLFRGSVQCVCRGFFSWSKSVGAWSINVSMYFWCYKRVEIHLHSPYVFKLWCLSTGTTLPSLLPAFFCLKRADLVHSFSLRNQGSIRYEGTLSSLSHKSLWLHMYPSEQWRNFLLCGGSQADGNATIMCISDALNGFQTNGWN